MPDVEPLDAAAGAGPFRSVAHAIEGFGNEQEWAFEGEATRYRLVGEYSSALPLRPSPQRTGSRYTIGRPLLAN
jgi:hypothetical protein